MKKNSTTWFIFSGEQVLLLKERENYVLPSDEQIENLPQNLRCQHSLGTINEHHCRCGEINTDTPIPAAMEFINLRKALQLLGPSWFSATAKAYQVISWDKNHQYCGRCGNKTFHKTNTLEQHCPVCAMIFYPRISPSIIVLIKRDNKILMARSPHFAPGVYGLIAGFIEPGESAEEAIHRETKEEVSIAVKNIRYFGSQPWPFPDSLMLAFTADYASGEIIIDNHEIEAADWYDANNLPGLPSVSISIGRKLIDQFVEEQKA